MQTLDIISVNLWHILASLANLLIIFWIVKKLLFGPVRKVLEQRQADIDHRYAAADEAQRIADENRDAWETKLKGAQDEANAIIQEATNPAKYRAEQIVSEADARAEGMVAQAKAESELERRRAVDGIKREIVDVSAALAEKMLEREVNTKDHRALIDSFIEKIGEDDEGDR